MSQPSWEDLVWHTARELDEFGSVRCAVCGLVDQANTEYLDGIRDRHINWHKEQ